MEVIKQRVYQSSIITELAKFVGSRSRGYLTHLTPQKLGDL
jgi:hypothetical protein